MTDEPSGARPAVAREALSRLPASFAWREARTALPASYREAGSPRLGRLEWRWRGRFGGVGLFGLFWGGGVSSFGVLMLFVREGWRPSAPPWLLGVATLAVGLAALYIALANLVNVTRVSLTPTTLIREDGPLPWRRRVEVLLSEVEIQVAEVRRTDVRHGGDRSPAPLRFDVVGHVTHERSIVLFDLLPSRDEAERVASALREAMRRGAA